MNETGRDVVLNACRMTNRNRAHRYIKWKLSLPAYYGMNLDALHDCLTEAGKIHIRIRHSGRLERNLGEYGARLREVFTLAAGENPRIRVDMDGRP